MMSDEDFIREVEKSERTLYRVSKTMLRNDADCCDAVQEALTKAWAHRQSVKTEYFKTWLVRILINECHNIGRKLAKAPTIEEMTDRPAPVKEDTGLMEAMGKLKEPWRIVLTLHYLEGFTLAEIARMTHVPLSTAKYRIVRARQALRLEMEGQGKKGGAEG